MEIPDVTGRTLGEAKALLEKAGVALGAVKMTAPPRLRHIEPDDSCRVLRIKSTDNRIELLVCRPL